MASKLAMMKREPIKTPIHQTRLKAIEGSISVSSEQIGMEKEKCKMDQIAHFGIHVSTPL